MWVLRDSLCQLQVKSLTAGSCGLPIIFTLANANRFYSDKHQEIFLWQTLQKETSCRKWLLQSQLFLFRSNLSRRDLSKMVHSTLIRGLLRCLSPSLVDTKDQCSHLITFYMSYCDITTVVEFKAASKGDSTQYHRPIRFFTLVYAIISFC